VFDIFIGVFDIRRVERVFDIHGVERVERPRRDRGLSLYCRLSRVGPIVLSSKGSQAMVPLLHRRSLCVLPLFAGLLLCLACSSESSSNSAAAPGDGSYLFAFWNIENFFDGNVDGWKTEPDKTYDAWFASDKEALEKKLDNITSIVAGLNDGKGPDIFCAAEVESTERAADLLKDRLNAKIKDPAQHYKHVLFKDPKGGRHIATAIYTRLPVTADKTHLHGTRHRILEGHIHVNGHDLVVIASHWTSRVSDEKGEGRAKYANEIYGVFNAMHKSNPGVDLIVCGDFNDNPTDPSVTEHLHAVGDPKKVLGSNDPPLLFDLIAQPKFEGKGTHFYRGKPFLFDHIVVSPGMLDKEGWSCEPDSMTIITDKVTDSKGRPKRFGDKEDKGERGYSDHLPVTVRLKVAK
jgi:endonuclease/exonuclease/phosphatase family metal-dependent hydrolase